MKTILIYSAALLALCVLVFRKDQTQPTATGKFDARVTILGIDSRDQAEGILHGLIGFLNRDDLSPVGQVAPEGMLS